MEDATLSEPNFQPELSELGKAFKEQLASLHPQNKQKLLQAVQCMTASRLTIGSGNSLLQFKNKTFASVFSNFLNKTYKNRIKIKPDGENINFISEKNGIFAACLKLQKELPAIISLAYQIDKELKTHSVLKTQISTLTETFCNQINPSKNLETKKIPEPPKILKTNERYQSIINEINSILDLAVTIIFEKETLFIPNQHWDHEVTLADHFINLLIELEQFGLNMASEITHHQQGFELHWSDYIKLRLLSEEKLLSIHSLYHLLHDQKLIHHSKGFDLEDFHILLLSNQRFAYIHETFIKNTEALYGKILTRNLFEEKYLNFRVSIGIFYSPHLVIYKNFYHLIINAYVGNRFNSKPEMEIEIEGGNEKDVIRLDL